ncbi:MAG: exodeoxyribonuclease V subunit alpha [Candidatus Protochlamydia sp.]|nr:exodeoxyribonuclease V subunit alpha [Candidatus Protochlamydia sp.]
MGLAKKSFLKISGHAPWQPRPTEKKQNWPFVERLLDKEQLSFLDYRIAQCVFSSLSVEENAALFLCHLVKAAREGHLCVLMNDNDICPSVNQLWLGESDQNLTGEEVEILTEKIVRGALQVPPSLISLVQTQISPPPTYLCRFGNYFYLQKNWLYESIFLDHFQSHLNTKPSIKLDASRLNAELSQLNESGALLKEQSTAILKGALSSFSIISGGPGTGKTYTAGRLIQIFWNSLSDEQRKNCEIALAAPTGKAAANLQKSLSQVMGQLEDFPPLQVKTLHSLLGIKPSSDFLKETPNGLAADFIVIDESSMLDVKMMAALFRSIKKGARIVLLGDPHQLPSVEAGSLFVDLIKQQPLFSFPYTHLKVCLRTELSSIVSFAELINQGKAQEAIDLLNCSSIPGISRLSLPQNRREAHQTFLKHMACYFPSAVKSDHNPEEILELFNAIRILSPMRKGPFGVEEINKLLWTHLSQQKGTGWMPIPIMIVTNDYRLDLFNGETGVLMRKLPLGKFTVEDFALFPGRGQGDKPRHFSALLLPSHEYAYCLSVHKSQGSEFDRVLVMLPERSEMFGREVLYTAVTRARKHIEVCGSDEVIQKTIFQKGSRLSGIEARVSAGLNLLTSI